MRSDPTLRPFSPDDAAAFHDAVVESVDELVPWMPWCHAGYTMEEATTWTKFQSEQFAKRAEFQFLVHDGSRLAGVTGLNRIDLRDRLANVGYWIRSSATRRGIATAALKLLVGWAAANTDLHRLEILIASGNVASMRVAEKCGAVREAVVRERLLLQDRFHDATLHSLIRGRDF